MNIREALANTILELSNSEVSEGGFFPFLISDYDNIYNCVRRPTDRDIPYMPHGGYDGSAGSKFLIIGPPETGKTKEAIEIIYKLNRLKPRTILYSLDSMQLPTKIPEAIKRDSSVVVFIDDFGQDCLHVQKRPPILATRGGFPRPLEKLAALVEIFDSHFKDVNFIITINKEYFDALKKEDEGHNLLLQFKRIELQALTPRQTDRFISHLGKALNINISSNSKERLLKLTYGSISSLVYFFHTLSIEGVTEVSREHVNRYYELFKMGWQSVHKKFNNDEKSILKALANLRSELLIPHKDLVIEVAKAVNKSFSFKKRKKLQEAMDNLLGKIIFENEGVLLCYDSLLPETKILPLETLTKIVLDFAKKYKPGTYTRQSLLNFSDRLTDDNKIDLNLQVNQRLHELLPEYPEVTYNMGILRAAKGQVADAEKHFQALIAAHPDDALSYYNYGVFLSDQKKIEEAEKQYLKALELSPNDADIHIKYAAVLMSLKRFKEAEAEFRKGVELNPFDASARNTFGVLLRNLNQVSQAEHQYRQAIHIDPTYARAYKNLGVLLFSHGRIAEAEKNYRKSLELDDADPRTHFNLAVLLRQLGRKEEAEIEYRKSIDLEPTYAKTYNNLGVLLFSQGRYEEAEALYKKAIELDKNYKDAHYNLTLVYEKTGDAEKAIEHWEAITRA